MARETCWRSNKCFPRTSDIAEEMPGLEYALDREEEPMSAREMNRWGEDDDEQE